MMLLLSKLPSFSAGGWRFGSRPEVSARDQCWGLMLGLVAGGERKPSQDAIRPRTSIFKVGQCCTPDKILIHVLNFLFL